MTAYPDKLQILPDRSHPDINIYCAQAIGHLAVIMDLGVSPIAMICNEAWKPILQRLADRHGYCWEWVSTDGSMTASTEHYARTGEAVMTKVP